MSDTPIIPLLINGQKIQSKSNKFLDVLNPADQSVVAKVPLCRAQSTHARDAEVTGISP